MTPWTNITFRAQQSVLQALLKKLSNEIDVLLTPVWRENIHMQELQQNKCNGRLVNILLQQYACGVYKHPPHTLNTTKQWDYSEDDTLMNVPNKI